VTICIYGVYPVPYFNIALREDQCSCTMAQSSILVFLLMTSLLCDLTLAVDLSHYIEVSETYMNGEQLAGYTDQAECEAFCDAEARCQGFMVYSTGGNSGRGPCYAYHDMTFRTVGDWISYIKKGSACSQPETISNGAVSQKGNVAPGNAVAIEYSCNDGYVMEGSYRRVCAGYNAWEDPAPSCIAECGDVLGLFSQTQCGADVIEPEDCEDLGCCYVTLIGKCAQKPGRIYSKYGSRRPDGRDGFAVLDYRTESSCKRECDIRPNCKAYYIMRSGEDMTCHLVDFTYTEASNIMITDGNADFYST
jgi:hypothetical protein